MRGASGSAMSEKVIHAFEFLRQAVPDPLPPVLAALGPDRFLKRRVLDQLSPRRDQDDSLITLAGSTATWRDVRDELSLVSLFGDGPRRVVIAEADDFISQHREDLEQYTQHPLRSGVLILDVVTLPSNTRLYKAIQAQGLLIVCRLPESQRGRGVDVPRLRKWLEEWARDRHGLRLSREALEELTGLVGWELGLLDQELAKLALFVKSGESADADLVRRVVGGWRAQTTWQMLDAAASGNASQALVMLDQLLQAGETPQSLFGSVAWSLRRFAAATRIYQRMEHAAGRAARLPAALQQAGFRAQPPTLLSQAEEQLRQLSRERAGRLFQWLLELDLALKGTHAAPQRGRLALEMLLLRLSKPARPVPIEAARGRT